MRAAVRQTRLMERLVRRSKAKAPAGFNPLGPIYEQLIYKFEFSRVKIAGWNLKPAAQDRS